MSLRYLETDNKKSMTKMFLHLNVILFCFYSFYNYVKNLHEIY